MKVVSFADFLKLPEGTIFAPGSRWSFEGLQLKLETSFHDGRAIDYFYVDLVTIEPQGDGDGGDYFDALETMIETGSSLPLNEASSREGLFDKDRVYLVYERDDLLRLYSIIGTAAAKAPCSHVGRGTGR